MEVSGDRPERFKASKNRLATLSKIYDKEEARIGPISYSTH
jgi:hypothetical protein